MSNFILNNTAEEVNSAIGKVAGADNTPTDISPLMVTSGGVKAYVDSQVSAVDSRVTAAQADISSLQGARIAVATYSRTAYTSYSNTKNIVLSESYDPENIGTVLTSGTYSGGVRVSGGTYLITFTGGFSEHDFDFADRFTVNLRSSGTILHSQKVNETGDLGSEFTAGTYNNISFTQVLTIPENSTTDINIQVVETSTSGLRSVNVFLTLMRLG